MTSPTKESKCETPQSSLVFMKFGFLYFCPSSWKRPDYLKNAHTDTHRHTSVTFSDSDADRSCSFIPHLGSPSSPLCVDTSLPAYTVLASGHGHPVNLGFTFPEDVACAWDVAIYNLLPQQISSWPLQFYSARLWLRECIFVEIAYSAVTSHISQRSSQAPKARHLLMTSNPCHIQFFLFSRLLSIFYLSHSEDFQKTFAITLFAVTGKSKDYSDWLEALVGKTLDLR